MLDFKFQYLNNIISNYYSHGYNALSVYDKYHIILMVVDYLSCNFALKLGVFISTLFLPKKILNTVPLIGFKNNQFVVPKLSEMSLSVIQRNRLYYPNNNYYNLLILRSEELYTIHDRNNLMFEYFRCIYNHQPKLLITTLIDRYTLTRTAPYMYYTESDSDSEGHLTGDDSYTEFIDRSDAEESESESENED